MFRIAITRSDSNLRRLVAWAAIVGALTASATVATAQSSPPPQAKNPTGAAPKASPAPPPPSIEAFFGGGSRGTARQIDSQSKRLSGSWSLTVDNALEVMMPGGVVFRAEPVAVDRKTRTLMCRVIVIDTFSMLADPESWRIQGGGQIDFAVGDDDAFDAVSRITWRMNNNQSVQVQRPPAHWKFILN